MGYSGWGAETLPYCSSLLHTHSGGSGFLMGGNGTIVYSACHSTHVVPLYMFPGLEGKLGRCRAERGGR